MSKYDPNGQEIDDLLRQVDSLLDEHPEEDWLDDDDDNNDIDVDEYTPAEAVTDDTQIFYQNFSNDYGRQVRNYQNGYGGREAAPEPIRSEPSIPAYNADFQRAKRERSTSSQAYKAQKQHQSRERKTEYHEYTDPVYDEPPAQKLQKQPRQPKPKKSRGCCGCGCTTMLVALVLVIAAAVGVWLWVFQPPVSESSIGDRKSDTASILICGTDADGTRTDTMMLLYLSGSEDKVGLLSLPRDTYTITSAGKAAKLNSAYGRNGTGEEGMEGLLDYVQDIIGYRPDGYILVDMTLVPQIVDLMGGVDVEVPQTMSLEGTTLEAGMQHLDGEQVLTLLRFRKGYATADLARIEVQRSVIKACMEQWISLSHLQEVGQALSMLESGSLSTLDTRNYLWVAKTILGSLSGGFTTETLPGYADYIGSASYYLLNRDEVAQLINDSFNPYKVTIAPEDLNIAG